MAGGSWQTMNCYVKIRQIRTTNEEQPHPASFSLLLHVLHCTFSIFCTFTPWLTLKERKTVSCWLSWSVRFLFFKAKVKANQRVLGRQLWKPQLTKSTSLIIRNYYCFFKLKRKFFPQHVFRSSQERKQSRSTASTTCLNNREIQRVLSEQAAHMARKQQRPLRKQPFIIQYPQEKGGK